MTSSPRRLSRRGLLGASAVLGAATARATGGPRAVGRAAGAAAASEVVPIDWGGLGSYDARDAPAT
ncbi:hypothetical protein [Streptomyces radicis]|uniref:hypothetical protein n=1 Tax=Streptomyces radicis TaxID=1750517 RepID=UPI001E614ECB|nr:hypothetical protein [Streptomyces radicis]